MSGDGRDLRRVWAGQARGTIDKELQAVAIAVAHAQHRGAVLNSTYREIALDEMTRHCKNFFARCAAISSSCNECKNLRNLVERRGRRYRRILLIVQ
jgi:hypothetical protein